MKLFIVALLWNTLLSGVIAVETKSASDVPKLLDKYDTEGPYSLGGSSHNAQDRPIIEARIRSFLWSRWQQHRLAYLIVIRYSLEGMATRSWYFVEPDRENKWRIVIRMERTLFATDVATGEHYRETTSFEARFIKRIEVPAYDSPSRVEIPGYEARSAEDYRVQLKDEHGKIIAEL